MIRRVVLIAMLAAVHAAAANSEDGDLRRLFPREADVHVVGNGGLARLELTAEILAACRPDLSDLRLVDRRGSEIAYVVDTAPASGGPSERTERVDATILDARREEVRREHAPPLHRETYVVVVPERAGGPRAWELVFATEHPRFVRRVEASAETADGSAVRIIENGSVFRLPNAPTERTRLVLPPLPGARLTVVLEGEDGFYLEPRLAFESTTAVERREEIQVALEEIARERSDGRTVVELVRPRGLVPDVVRLETSTPSFDRTVEVWDVGPGVGAELLGRAELFRLQAAASVSARDLALRPARGDRLRIEIADGDSAALDGLAFVGVVRRPALIFSLPADAADGPAATLLFGGGRAFRPRYDLAALLAPRAEAGDRLGDPARAASARLGASRPNPAFDGTPALAFAMKPGAEIDRRVYERRRTLAVRPSSEGLSRLVLGPEDVAGARPDLADVRVVDASGRQWPYLLEPEGTRRWQRLAIAPAGRGVGTSRYRLGLPITPCRFDQLVLDAGTTFFDRAFRLVAETDEGERTLAQGRLAQQVGKPGSLTIVLAPTRVRRLELTVVDGDDAPLALREARARLVLPELFLAAPAGEYFLLAGHPGAGAPRYELARVRDVVLAVSSAPVEAGEPVANPDYSFRARLTGGEGRESGIGRIVLWLVLALAVLVLTALTLRLARSG